MISISFLIHWIELLLLIIVFFPDKLAALILVVSALWYIVVGADFSDSFIAGILRTPQEVRNRLLIFPESITSTVSLLSRNIIDRVFKSEACINSLLARITIIVK